MAEHEYVADDKVYRVDVIWTDDDMHEGGKRTAGRGALEGGEHVSGQGRRFTIKVVAISNDLGRDRVAELLALHWPDPERGERPDSVRIWVADLVDERTKNDTAGEPAIRDFYAGKIAAATNAVLIASSRSEALVDELEAGKEPLRVRGIHIPLGTLSRFDFDGLIAGIGNVLDGIIDSKRAQSGW